MCVQLRAKACQFIGTSLKKDSNVLFLHVSHQLVQLLRIVSVWNSVTVENSQVNVSILCEDKLLLCAKSD